MEGAGAGEKKAAEGPATLKEAAKKRNTDCIYFLASPCVCNKGKSCEYRHSDGARVNPRDCWYWLNGNCLNLKCSFRHPPLDGLIGIPGASSLPTPPSQTVATPQILVQHPSASHNPRKQSVTCYFFQKGQCLKGDKCAFVHDPESNESELTGIPVPRQVIMVSQPNAETSKTNKKESWGLRPCARQKIPRATNEKLVGSLPLSETMPTSYQSRPADEHFQNDSGADVATDLRRLMLKGKFDYLRSGREDKYYGQEQQRTFSKRYKDGQVMSGKRVRHRVECTDEIDKSDLRYRLLKQRRLHSPRSVVSSDVRGKTSWKDDRGQASCRKDHCLEAEKCCGLHSSKDQQHLVPKSSTTRLQGRIKFPARNSHDGPVDSQSERQQGRERHRGGLALTKLTLNQEGHSDGLKRKLPVCFDVDARSIRRHPARRLAPDHLNFTGPKTLAELKGAKVLDTSQERSNKSIRRHPVRRLDPDHLNFTGPKSLAELKGAKVVDTSQEQSNKSISSKLSLEGTSPTPPNNVLNSESLSPPENTGLCSNGKEIDDALVNKGLVPEGVVDGQSTVKSLVQMECDVTNAAEDRENPEQNEESDEVYEDDVQMIEEEERENLRIEEEESENLEQTEETGEVYDYEDDVQWTEDESFSEEYASEFSDDNDDFARKVALLLSGTSYSEIAV